MMGLERNFTSPSDDVVVGGGTCLGSREEGDPPLLSSSLMLLPKAWGSQLLRCTTVGLRTLHHPRPQQGRASCLPAETT